MGIRRLTIDALLRDDAEWKHVLQGGAVLAGLRSSVSRSQRVRDWRLVPTNGTHVPDR
jgi:hypothetical protein